MKIVCLLVALISMANIAVLQAETNKDTRRVSEGVLPETDVQTISTETANELNALDEEAGDSQFFIQESDEDIINYVDDFIKKDIQLKGSFLIEDVPGNKILKLKFESINMPLKTNEDGTKSVETLFKDTSGKKYIIIFNLTGAQWGGIDIFKIEFKKETKAQKKEQVKPKK